jgi:hypothetical protein
VTAAFRSCVRTPDFPRDGRKRCKQVTYTEPVVLPADGTGLYTISPMYGFQPEGLNGPAALALALGRPSVTVTSGIEAPVETSVQGALLHNTLGRRP